jgi:methylenetetrahydrofolate/methylenetetrahydromethanopterin dehydrogenase (NADP+)
MSDKANILIHFDTDPQPSSFDRVVAVDAGANHVFSYGGVKPDQVQSLVHGAIFTRGPKDLHHTAIFIGGSDVTAGERILDEVRKTMLPKWGLQVSVMLDSNGCNTTAAAAVRAAARHLNLKDAPAVVLGATGPVGQRVARLLAREGAEVRVGSRQHSRAEAIAATIRTSVDGARITGVATGTSSEISAAVRGQALVFAAGAAGVVLLPRSIRDEAKSLKVAIDLNAVPPVGIEGVETSDKGKDRNGTICYGAIGVGDTKMKVHKAAIARLFENNSQILDAEQIYVIAALMP